MLGEGVMFEQSGSAGFDVRGQMEKLKGDRYVSGVCMKSHGFVESGNCAIGWMDDLYELSMEADKVLTF